MEQLDYNTTKRQKTYLYSNKKASNYIKKNYTENNSYLENSKQDNKKNLTFMDNRNLIEKAISNNNNNNNMKRENNPLTNHYSYPINRINSQVTNSNRNNNSLMEQYSLKKNLKSKNYLTYLQNQRNTYDNPHKNLEINNMINSNLQKLNKNKINDFNNPKNVNKDRKFADENNSIEKYLILNKLNSSKSSNQFNFHDISIEYNNAPAIKTKRNNNTNINSFSNESISYIYKNSNYANRKEITNENYNDSLVSQNNYNNNIFKKSLNYESYIKNSINKNKNLNSENYFDSNLSKINTNNQYITDIKKYNNSYSRRKKNLESSDIIDNLSKKEIKIVNKKSNIEYSYNNTSDKYQNDNKKKGHEINRNYTTIKKGNIEINKNNHRNNNAINNSINILSPKNANIKNNNKNNNKNNINLIYNITYNNNINPALKNIFCTNETKNNVKTNISPKIIKNNSPDQKNNLNNNDNKIKMNNKKIILNYSKNKNNNIINDEQKNNDTFEKYEAQYSLNSSNRNMNNNDNKKNLMNQHKISFKKENFNQNLVYNSGNRGGEEKTNLKYNTNFNSKKCSMEKKMNLTENSHSKSNYLDSKIKTNRNEPSKIKKENLIFSADNLYNNTFNINNFGYKSSKNIIISKNDVKMLNNLLSDRKEINNSPNSNSIFHFNSNYKKITRNKNNNMNNIINIDLDVNSKYNNHNYSIKNISQFASNKNEENNNKETAENIIITNNNYFKNENKKNMISKNNNENSFSILKNLNTNTHLNNNPVKLYISKEESKNNKEFLKDNRDNFDKNNKNNQKNTNFENANNKNNNRNKRNINIDDNAKTNNNVLKNENNKNMNNNIISNSKILNIKTKSINKTKFNNSKNNEINVKNVANELFEKNKNKNIIKPKINKAKTNYINTQNNSSNIRISTNTIRNNNNLCINKTGNNNIKSYINILDRNEINNLNNKKKLNINNSEEYIFNTNRLVSESSKANEKNKISSNNMEIKTYRNNHNLYVIKDIKKKDLKINNIGIINPIKTENNENNKINNNNYYKRNSNKPLVSPKNSNINNKIALTSANNSIQLNNNNKYQSPNGVYIKPFCVLSLSKPKKRIIKSKSEFKMNSIIYQNDNDKNTKSSLKRTKESSKSFISDIYSNTSPNDFQKDEYFKNNICYIKRGSVGSLNINSFNKNILNNGQDNENKSYENQSNMENSIFINTIKKSFLKSYCFYSKLCNYYIKKQTIEKCYFSKGAKNNQLFNKSIKNKNRKIPMVQGIFTNNNNDEEKNNESSQNGLIMTFGEMNNIRKTNEKSYAFNNSNNKFNDDYILEDSDLDIYKSLQQGTYQYKYKNEKISNENSSSNIINSENEDLKIYELLEKEKNDDKNIISEIYKTTNGKEIDEDYEKKCKTFKKSFKYKLENAEKGLKILFNIALRREIKSNSETLNNNTENNENNDNYNKINENINIATNKIKDIFNSRKETESSNSYNKNSENYNIINGPKYSKSVNKDIIQGLSKIENILEKNRIIINEKAINTYVPKNKNNNKNNSKDNDYNDIMNYSEIMKTKKKTCKSKTNLGSSNDNNTFDSYLDFINGYNNAKLSRYKESEILSNKHRTESRNSNENRDSILHIRCNLLNDEIFNNDLLSYSDEEIKPNNFNIEEFEKYLKEIKIQQSDNIIKHDIIFLLNILVENNYSIVLNEITKIILYKEKDIINNNNDIVENEHIFKDIIFVHINKSLKFIFLYAKICNDLNNNIINTLREQKNMKINKERNLKFIINEECISFLNNLKSNENYRDKNLESNNKNDIYDFSREKIIEYVTFVYELIKLEVLKQQFGLYFIDELFKIYSQNDIYNIKLDIYLEAIVILIDKLGKIIFEKNNEKLIDSINNFIDNTLNGIINNKNINRKVPEYLKYKIMNLITRRNNKWEDTLSEILEKEEKKTNEHDDMINKIWNKEINIDDLNKSIIEEDLVNYISYFTEENNKGQINIKNNIEKSYNWKIIEELIIDKNFGLE